mmetsp:Transcript_17571/g.56651  ORF Transcript_17571/g.56651 Transcript_17571/m.56651 type:complete len:285 (-) Transcript_17571:5378-6232(-)
MGPGCGCGTHRRVGVLRGGRPLPLTPPHGHKVRHGHVPRIRQGPVQKSRGCGDRLPVRAYPLGREGQRAHGDVRGRRRGPPYVRAAAVPRRAGPGALLHQLLRGREEELRLGAGEARARAPHAPRPHAALLHLHPRRGHQGHGAAGHGGRGGGRHEHDQLRRVPDVVPAAHARAPRGAALDAQVLEGPRAQESRPENRPREHRQDRSLRDQGCPDVPFYAGALSPEREAASQLRPLRRGRAQRLQAEHALLLHGRQARRRAGREAPRGRAGHARRRWRRRGGEQ